MKKLFVVIVLTVLFPLFLLAQEKISYFDSNGNIIEFDISKNWYHIKSDSIQLIDQYGIPVIIYITENEVLIYVENLDRLFEENIDSLHNEIIPKDAKIKPVLIYEDGTKQVCRNEIILKLNQKILLNSIFIDMQFTEVPDEFVDNQFVVTLPEINYQELFELVNDLQNNSKVDFIEPNFTKFIYPATIDPFYDSQWSINNAGYMGGTVDADMDVDEAWQISTGLGIKVAIIDEGVDLTHNDLTPNLLTGYDATDFNLQGAPNESNDDAHGTACAGIVAAVANNSYGNCRYRL